MILFSSSVKKEIVEKIKDDLDFGKLEYICRVKTNELPLCEEFLNNSFKNLEDYEYIVLFPVLSKIEPIHGEPIPFLLDVYGKHEPQARDK